MACRSVFFLFLVVPSLLLSGAGATSGQRQVGSYTPLFVCRTSSSIKSCTTTTSGSMCCNYAVQKLTPTMLGSASKVKLTAQNGVVPFGTNGVMQKIVRLILSGNFYDDDDVLNLPIMSTSLTHMDLSMNRLKVITTCMINRFPLLEVLYLHGNIIDEIIPDAFFGLPELNSLSLGTNNLKALPISVFKYNKKLKNLSLRQNYFKDLPETIVRKGTQLSLLSISGNQLDVNHGSCLAHAARSQLDADKDVKIYWKNLTTYKYLVDAACKSVGGIARCLLNETNAQLLVCDGPPAYMGDDSTKDGDTFPPVRSNVVHPCPKTTPVLGLGLCRRPYKCEGTNYFHLGAQRSYNNAVTACSSTVPPTKVISPADMGCFAGSVWMTDGQIGSRDVYCKLSA